MLRDRHQFDVGKSALLHIGDQPISEFGMVSRRAPGFMSAAEPARVVCHPAEPTGIG